MVIHRFEDGVFYAKIICTDGATHFEIDARTSDAVAIALRVKCDIFTLEHILDAAGIVMGDNSDNLTKITEQHDKKSDAIIDSANEFEKKTDEQLEELLQGAIDEEHYERASLIRDEQNKRKAKK